MGLGRPRFLSRGSELALAMHSRPSIRTLAERRNARRTRVVEAIQDQWAIVAAVVVLVIAAIVWVYARR